MNQKSLSAPAVFGALLFCTLANPGYAGDELVQAGGETVIERHDSGSIHTEKLFNPKYIERFNTYDEQINMGLSKGWLSQPEAERLRARLSYLRQLNDTVSRNGYQKAQADDLEKQVTKFNEDFTASANKPAPAAASAVKDKASERDSASAKAENADASTKKESHGQANRQYTTKPVTPAEKKVETDEHN